MGVAGPSRPGTRSSKTEGRSSSDFGAPSGTIMQATTAAGRAKRTTGGLTCGIARGQVDTGRNETTGLSGTRLLPRSPAVARPASVTCHCRPAQAPGSPRNSRHWHCACPRDICRVWCPSARPPVLFRASAANPPFLHPSLKRPRSYWAAWPLSCTPVGVTSAHSARHVAPESGYRSKPRASSVSSDVLHG